MVQESSLVKDLWFGILDIRYDSYKMEHVITCNFQDTIIVYNNL